MSRQHLLIKELFANRASANTNFYCVGMPALTSFAGYVDYLKRKINTFLTDPIENISFSVFVHRVDVRGGNERGERNMSYEGQLGHSDSVYTTKLKAGEAAPLEDDFKCDIKVSMIISFDMKENPVFGTDESDVLTNNMGKLKNIMRASKFCAGKTVSINQLMLSSNKAMIYESLLRSSPSYAISSATDLFNDYMELFDNDASKAVTYACEGYKDEDGDLKRNQKGIVRPTNIGYIEITKAETNIPISRDLDTPFAYVDCITGLIKFEFGYRVIRKLISNDTDVEHRITFTSHYNDGVYQVLNQTTINTGV